MKCLTFASRNIKEILRDPLSWVFCMGFPLLMLFIMSIVNNSIPAETGMILFRMDMLAPGITVFGFTFVMLFACLLIAGDRNDSFLMRVFCSPMKPVEYILGYILPLILLSVCQAAIMGICALIGAGDCEFGVVNVLTAILFSIPSAVMFISFGLLFGTIVNKNAAPGMCSIIISFSGILGGIYMDVDAVGGTFGKVCNILPFIHSVKIARLAYAGEYSESLVQVGIITVWAIVITALAAVVFRKKMKY